MTQNQDGVTPSHEDIPPHSPGPGSAGEVFRTFLRLGLTAFGGPIAHLGYFREEIVLRRRWIDEAGYSDLVALCQFLPGPASSQVGFALGLLRGGPLGAVAAWTAFTLPSAILLVLFAVTSGALSGPIGAAIIHGLKVVAVAVVAQAVWGMGRALCPDWTRRAIAVAAALIVSTVSGFAGQFAAMLAGGLAGLWLCRDAARELRGRLVFPVSKRAASGALITYAGLLVVLPVAAGIFSFRELALVDAFYRSGAFVFGGGHVVLPLLNAAVVETGWVSKDTFLAGYGAVQAVPGPLFTFAAFLGAATTTGAARIFAAALSLLAIFLPGLLLVVGVLPFWDAFRMRPRAQAVMRGANAAVVGLLAAALYNPIGSSALYNWSDISLATLGVVLLIVWKQPAWVVVLLLTLGEILVTVL